MALGGISASVAEVEFPGAEPGAAQSQSTETAATLSNNVLKATFANKGGKISFEGMESTFGKARATFADVADEGGELFIIHLGNGKKIKSSDLKAEKFAVINLKANPKSATLAERQPGKAIAASFSALNGNLKITWRAVLRDGSHYLRQELKLTAAKAPIPMKGVTAMQYDLEDDYGQPTISGNARGAMVVTKRMFAALETPMGINTYGNQGAAEGGDVKWSATSWVKDSWTGNFNIPANLKQNYGDRVSSAEGPVNIDGTGNCAVKFQYKGGNHRLNMVGVHLPSPQGAGISEEFHIGPTGHQSTKNTYTVKVPKKGKYLLRYWAQTKTESINSNGDITFSLPVTTVEEKQDAATDDELAQGFWKRNTTLKAGESWRVSNVLGVFAPDQQRRSFLAYIERERAVPYRPFIHYNSWYELNINRNNDANPEKRMTEAQCLAVVKDWQEKFFNRHGVTIDAFVWDDGWDEFNSLWGFHKCFPAGFKNIDKIARAQNVGIGAWLGPVGGYGAAKAQRLGFWNKTHPNNQIGNFQLSNKEYFDAFVGRCSQMVKDYNMKYFKFDGISTHFHAKGPGNEEDAEGIINVVNALREKKEDLFINCTVGTWASPFWFRYADSVWRQENDFGTEGVGDKRDQWITYRDRLVHEVFVEGSPLMPINSLMTHGLIVSKHGPPACMSREPEHVVKELRCAIACGTALQELYLDRDLMDAKNGMLWAELAAGVKWIRRNADVLDDVHWVGGNPWDKNAKEGSVYGWAAWNKNKATMALRNSSDKEKTLTASLREILDIPAKVKGSITFKDSFKDQRALDGFSNQAVDIDKELNFTLKPFEVLVYEGGKVK